MTLSTLQAAFQTFLLKGDADISDRIAGTPSASATERLQVYGNAYRQRLTEALAQDYPKLRNFIGEDRFAAMAHAYIDSFPSTHPSLRWFGRHLAKFLRTVPWSDQPVLSELADFEWTMGQSFDAADTPTLTVDAMSAIPPQDWAGLQLGFQSALRTLRLQWNISALWKALDEAQPHPATEASSSATDWLIWRRDLKIYWRALQADEAEALESARSGASFGVLCELLCARVGETEAPMRAASLLRQWLTDGLVSCILYQPE
jgi:hypothetical protein